MGKTKSGEKFDGIVYPSSKNRKDAVVLFNDEVLKFVDNGFKDML